MRAEERVAGRPRTAEAMTCRLPEARRRGGHAALRGGRPFFRLRRARSRRNGEVDLLALERAQDLEIDGLLDVHDTCSGRG